MDMFIGLYAVFCFIKIMNALVFVNNSICVSEEYCCDCVCVYVIIILQQLYIYYTCMCGYVGFVYYEFYFQLLGVTHSPFLDKTQN